MPKLKHLENLDKFRFYVANDRDCAISSVWFLRSERNGVFVGPSGLGGSLKLSFHDGSSMDGKDCQFGHPREHAQKEEANGFQPFAPIRWKRADTPEIGALHIASIVFPTDGLMTAPEPPPSGKVRFQLPAAPPGWGIEVGLFLSKVMPQTLEESFLRLGTTPIGFTDFPNNDYLSIAVRKRRLPRSVEFIASLNKKQHSWLSGAPDKGSSIEGRVVAIGRVPTNGEAFYLTEYGPVTVTRST